ncbi:HYR domain-containing protein [Segetibacter sp. 3557_3]|uniref:choice-of-anchor L domain-containing protein n=1 Tax=Segetibacter sp. 3557_3 TaxID=2547429 RepID=UPI001058A776|nr:choice-of-anchor L domain-containing protein [Segetibacter sp. 3557_3]TDH26761.1 HYR domain-containing protein [Segetibacter sp. 3557_3]
MNHQHSLNSSFEGSSNEAIGLFPRVFISRLLLFASHFRSGSISWTNTGGNYTGKRKVHFSRYVTFILCTFLSLLQSKYVFAQTQEELVARQANSVDKGATSSSAISSNLSPCPLSLTPANASTNSLSQIIQSLAGVGVTISNIQTTLPASSDIYGSFSCGSTVLGIDRGLVLTTGGLSNAKGPNTTTNAGRNNGRPGDADLNALITTSGHDASWVSFDIVPNTNTLTFRYVFSSEEYNDYVNSSFNDVFGFFISGPGIVGKKNLAVLPSSTIPVAINNVNKGRAPSTPASNPQYFINNDNRTLPLIVQPPNPVIYQNLEYDGLTVVLTATVTVTPGATYSLKFAIQDAGDPVYDSGVFIEGGSIQSCTLDISAIPMPASCAGNDGAIDLTISGGTAPYKVEWSNGETTDDIKGLSAGFYTVKVTDDLGCVKSLENVEVKGSVDNAPPTITAPADITVGNDAGVCSATIASLGTPKAADDCGLQSVTNDYPSTSFPVGTTTVTWTATDKTGKTASAIQLVIVKDIEDPVITCPFKGNINRDNDGGVCTWTSLNNDLDAKAKDNCSYKPMTYSLAGATSGAGNTLNGVTFNQGTTTVTWKAQDLAGHSVSCSFDVTVINTAPVFNSITGPTSPVAVGTPITINVDYTDNNVTSAVVKWEIGTDYIATNPPKQFSATNTYNTPGVYTVTVYLTDCGGTVSKPYEQYVVVYDPNGGFVTGGGCFISPAGAYKDKPTSTGKATFGFVSKYQKGASVPSGHTEFQYHVEGMNFNSTSYDWLVISGPKAQYKGKGKINGVPGYGFLLTANDGQVNGGGGIDKIRIKIWDLASSNIVYDNQDGADTDPATTALTCGSIVIHANDNKNSSISQSVREPAQLQAEYTGKLKVAVMPNPSSTSFRLVMQSGDSKPLNIRVLDIMGRVVEMKRNIAPNGTLTIGEGFGPGTYLVELQQGVNKVTMNLLKASK